MSKFVIAHDIGTSGDKATLFTTDGRLVKSTLSAYGTNYFNGNWAEQNAADWFDAFCKSTKELVDGIDVSDVEAVSFSGQMMGCVLVDKDGNLLRNAIIWADMRASKEAESIERLIPMDRFYRTTGHRCSSSYSLAKLMWVKNHEPEIFAKVYKMLNAKDYIIYKLTGQFLTDPSDASSTNALDLNTLKWSEEIIKASGVDISLFPEIVPSTHIAGEINGEVAKLCGLAAGTRVVVGGGDGMCASVGAGSVSVGKTYNCLGSSSWICTTSTKPVYDDQYRTFTWAHVVPGMYGPCGTMQTAGAAFAWLRNEICTMEMEMGKRTGKSAYYYMDEQIAQSKAGSNGVLFLPYLLGERSPRWNSDAKGAFIGIKLENTRADMLRSVMEGIGMNLNIILKVLQTKIEVNEMIVIGGLAKGAIGRQILADIFGMDILCLKHLDEASSIGAAVTACVGIGALKDFNETERFLEVQSRTSPIAGNMQVYQKLQPVFDKAYTSLTELFELLN